MFVAEGGQVAGGPLGREPLAPVLRVGNLGLKLTPSIGAGGMWGMGCHADRMVVRRGVRRGYVVSVHFALQLGTRKKGSPITLGCCWGNCPGHGVRVGPKST